MTLLISGKKATAAHLVTGGRNFALGRLKTGAMRPTYMDLEMLREVA